jgi:hypothetical protein
VDCLRSPAGHQRPDCGRSGTSAGHLGTQLGLRSSPVIDRVSRLAARWMKIWNACAAIKSVAGAGARSLGAHAG